MALTIQERAQALRLFLHEAPENARLGYTLLSAHPDLLPLFTWEFLVVAHLSTDPLLKTELNEWLDRHLDPQIRQDRQAALEVYDIHHLHRLKSYSDADVDGIIADHEPHKELLASIVLQNKTFTLLYLEIGYWLHRRAKLHLDFAQECYERVLEAHPDHLVVRYELAALHRTHTKDYALSAQYYRAIIDRAPDADRAYYQWGLLYIHYAEEHYLQAIIWLQKACALQPKEPTYFLQLAIAHQKAELFPELEALFQEGVERFPKYAPLMVQAANYWGEEAGELDRAEELYLRAIKADPRYVYALGNLAEFYADQRQDYAQAERFYYQTMRRQLHPYFMTNFISLLILHIGDMAAGKKYYLKRAELDTEQRREVEKELSEQQLLEYQQAEDQLLQWLVNPS